MVHTYYLIAVSVRSGPSRPARRYDELMIDCGIILVRNYIINLLYTIQDYNSKYSIALHLFIPSLLVSSYLLYSSTVFSFLPKASFLLSVRESSSFLDYDCMNSSFNNCSVFFIIDPEDKNKVLGTILSGSTLGYKQYSLKLKVHRNFCAR
jgi:hypothetical protein